MEDVMEDVTEDGGRFSYTEFNPMGTGGLFRPWVIKMLAISKRMIQLP